MTGVDRGRLEITGAEFIPATSFNYISNQTIKHMKIQVSAYVVKCFRCTHVVQNNVFEVECPWLLLKISSDSCVAISTLLILQAF